ncbi:MAG: 2-phospho-L-lactate transferase [Actinomycetota bacterium]
MKVTALAGGVGGAKLLIGLDRVADDLTAVVNTGDDATIYGLHVSPDVDIVTYWLAGIADTERGWGIRGDTWSVVDTLGKLGLENWFRLGDRDLATCLYRTGRLRDGATLSVVTAEITRSLGVRPTILPMSDDPVGTRVVTADDRTLEFQEYFVREKQQPDVKEVRFAGIADAKPAPGVIDALRSADVVILCPSNPVVSLAPILELPDVHSTIAEHPRVIGVSPIVRGAPLKGPADKLLTATGVEVSASGVAGLYGELLDTFVVDATDPDEVAKVEALGIRAVTLDTIMGTPEASERLAGALL